MSFGESVFAYKKNHLILYATLSAIFEMAIGGVYIVAFVPVLAPLETTAGASTCLDPDQQFVLFIIAALNMSLFLS